MAVGGLQPQVLVFECLVSFERFGVFLILQKSGFLSFFFPFEFD